MNNVGAEPSHEHIGQAFQEVGPRPDTPIGCQESSPQRSGGRAVVGMEAKRFGQTMP